MYEEPTEKRAVAFIDGSNIRHAARKAFGESFANFNPLALAEAVCTTKGWKLIGVQLYLGVPDVRVAEDAHYASIKRSARWRRQGVKVFTRTLYEDKAGVLHEKGIDVRLALDAVNMHRQQAFDIALIMSQDQDFAELAAEIKAMAREQGRWVQVASAFPSAQGEEHGIHGTLAVPIDRETFAQALDTPENRKRQLVPESEAARAPLPDEAAPNAIEPPLLAPVEPSVADTPSPSRPPLWAALAAGLYLIGAVMTGGMLCWQSRGTLLSSADEAGPLLAAYAVQAAAWPAYWLGSENIQALAGRLREADLVLPSLTQRHP